MSRQTQQKVLYEEIECRFYLQIIVRKTDLSFRFLLAEY